jgi:drug/metabolite transporter (DMT)-like permease
MRIIIAYISVVLLWATTPLAIKWSAEGPGFLFAVTSRMAIGTVCLLLVLIAMGQPLPWHKKAWFTYLAVALQIYGAMISVYWAAQFIPSGWISVLFGLAPLITALLARLILKERGHLSFSKLSAYALGIYGLFILFGSANSLGKNAELGIIGVLVSAFLQAISAVSLKRINAGISPLMQVTGGLVLSQPAYWLTWKVIEGEWPAQLSILNWAAILYLGLIATTIGFYLYYYLLTHLSATRVALISLVTPVMALILGHLINHEPLSPEIITGTTFILSALVMHELFGRIFRSV